ncbi:MAG: GAF domain-containing protein [Deltaproteobacteria bacterium]
MKTRDQAGFSLLGASEESKIEQIRDLVAMELEEVPTRLDELIDDVKALYEGNWDTYQQCQVGYHNFGHALDVSLAAGRMIAGWNLQAKEKIGEELLLSALAAALFHDAGYLKDKNDDEGKGGKFTFSHVPRSMEMAGQYLKSRQWPETICRLVPTIISLTEFNQPVDLQDKFQQPMAETVARMVATADLIAQMSDVSYMEHIEDLFQEFTEAYEVEGREKLRRRGVKVFGSAKEISEATTSFYRGFVLPRLSQLGGMSRYLIAFYGEDRNPYLESIAANLAGEAAGYQMHWRRIGNILAELGAVTAEQIRQALKVQRLGAEDTAHASSLESLRKKANHWIVQQLQGDYLGDILMQVSALPPSILRQGVIAQILPVDFTMRLNSRELLLLLHIMILLQNIHNGSWIFQQLLELVNEILECKASLIMKADETEHLLTVAYAAGDTSRQMEMTFAIDKGLAGWVFQHGKPRTVNRQEMEDKRSGPEQEAVLPRAVNMLAVPLYISGKRIGVIETVNKRSGEFTAHEMNLLSLIGNLISQSLPAALWL